MSSQAPASRLRAWLDTGSSIAIAMAVTNVGTYAYTMVAARILGPREYGAFAGLMATLLVFGVLQLGLQATAARRISAEPEHVGQIERSIMKVTYRSSLALGGLLVLAAPVIDAVLRLDSLVAAVLVGLAVVPTSIMGGQAGILQGERRWLPLGAVYLGVGIPRLAIGTALIVWRPSVELAMLGVLIALLVPVVIGAIALRHKREAGFHEDHRGRVVLRETVQNSQALLALFAISNIDVVIARNVLDEHDAGLYAAGLIMVKAVLFLPQFVVVVAFPSMSSPADRRRALLRSLVLVAAIGAVAILGAWALQDVALSFVGGDEYAEIARHLWLFAALGTLLAMLQLLVYSVLARRGQRSVYAVWMALALMVGAGMTTATVEGLLGIVLGVDALLFGALFVATITILNRSEPVREPVEVGR